MRGGARQTPVVQRLGLSPTDLGRTFPLAPSCNCTTGGRHVRSKTPTCTGPRIQHGARTLLAAGAPTLTAPLHLHLRSLASPATRAAWSTFRCTCPAPAGAAKPREPNLSYEKGLASGSTISVFGAPGMTRPCIQASGADFGGAFPPRGRHTPAKRTRYPHRRTSRLPMQLHDEQATK